MGGAMESTPPMLIPPVGKIKEKLSESASAGMNVRSSGSKSYGTAGAIREREDDGP